MNPEQPRDRWGEGLALVLASTLAYGSMPILAKVAYAAGMRTPGLLSYRFLIATPLFMLMARGRAPLPLRSRLLLWGLGIVFMANAFVYFKALETTPASVVSVILYTYPVWVTLLSAAAGLETVTVRSAITVSLAVVGCALAGGARLQAGDTRGVAFSLTASALYASYIVLSSRFASSLPPEAAARHISQVGAIVSVAWAAFSGNLAPPRTPVAWGAILTIALVCTVVAFRTFLAGLARVGPVTAALVSSFEVVMTMLLAMLFLDERPAGPQLAGATLILGAVVLQNARRLGR